MSQETFPNLPNFREVGGGRLVNKNGERIRSGVLYRASRTDFLTEEEIKTFLGYGFKTIIDMRTKSEFERADGEKLLVKYYEPLVLKGDGSYPFKPSYRWGGKLNKSMKEAARQKKKSPDSKWVGKRYLASLFSRAFFMHMFYKVNFISRYFSLILLAIDWFLGSHFFPKYFSWALVNSQTLPEQYVDMLEYSKHMIRSILNLLLDEDNLPVIINCTHGKDRTGVIVAVIMACLDMSEEDIINDYTESKVCVCMCVGGWVRACVRACVYVCSIYMYVDCITVM